jgi:hypothetical protein
LCETLYNIFGGTSIARTSFGSEETIVTSIHAMTYTNGKTTNYYIFLIFLPLNKLTNIFLTIKKKTT